ncbi:MAG: hypothetical protein ABFS41_15180, partial [Myxococcota bacterium]
AFDIAKLSLDRAVALNPDLADAHASLGLLKNEMWEETRSIASMEEAEVHFVTALELNPKSAEAAQIDDLWTLVLYLAIAVFIVMVGWFVAAGLVVLFLNMRVKRLEREHPEEARDYYELKVRLAALRRLRARASVAAGTAHIALGDAAAARESFDRALEADARLQRDPMQTSPKVLEAFEATRASRAGAR